MFFLLCIFPACLCCVVACLPPHLVCPPSPTISPLSHTNTQRMALRAHHTLSVSLPSSSLPYGQRALPLPAHPPTSLGTHTDTHTRPLHPTQPTSSPHCPPLPFPCAVWSPSHASLPPRPSRPTPTLTHPTHPHPPTHNSTTTTTLSKWLQEKARPAAAARRACPAPAR